MSKNFYTTEKLGPNRSLTPEGFLLCVGVPVARVGYMIYGPGEVPVEMGPDGVLKVFRNEEDLFRPETIASANGKPVTLQHPDDDVTPEDWNQLSVGTMLNVRRGEVESGDLLLADFMITNAEAIELINSDKLREVSLGYVADYYEVAVGEGRQMNILINHVALVEQGRCGPRCAIKDHKFTNPRGIEMALPKKWRDLLRQAYKAGHTKDEDELKTVMEDTAEELQSISSEGSGIESTTVPSNTSEEEVHVHIEGEDDGDGALEAHIAQNAAEHDEMRTAIEELRAEIAALKGATSTVDADPDSEGGDDTAMAEAMLDEVPDGLEEQAAKSNDSIYLKDAFREALSKAEVLFPGIQVATYDATAKPVNTMKQICSLRRKALRHAFTTDAALKTELNGGKSLKLVGMSCQAVKAMFNAAYMSKRVSNNLRVTDHATKFVDGQQSTQKVGLRTIADLNEFNKKTYGA